MKTVEKIGFQGDVAFVRVGELPKNAAARVGKNANVCAHSETGHHHVALDATLFDVGDPLVCYLRLEAPSAEIRHLRPQDTHEPLCLGGGVGATYKVIRQREHTPDGWRRVED